MAQTAPLALTPADQTLITQVETYLNAEKGMTANFLQVADDGSTRTGKAWLERPGRMRFEYDPPDPQLLVAGFGVLTYYDPQLGQTSNIPLGSTPLGILLATHVDLNSAGVDVTAISQAPGEDDITLVRHGKTSEGTLTLVFATNPLDLRQWVVTDAQGHQTRVSLYDVTAGGPYPDRLFQFQAPGDNSNFSSGG
jgi:outer membrane lipoprotein-sorting protein